MPDQLVFDRVKRILVDHLGVDPERISADSRLVEDLHADSLDAIELSMLAEEEFQVEITDDEINGLRVVADLVKIVEARA